MSCFTDIENKPDDWLTLDPLIVQKPIPKTGCDTNLIVLNYLSEFKTNSLKQKVKENLGIFTDTILAKDSINPIANKTVYEEFNRIKASAINKDGIGVLETSTTLDLGCKTLAGEEFMVEFPPATTKMAGVMSAADKENLEKTKNFLNRLMAGLSTSDVTVVADRILAVVNPANVEPEIPIEE